MLIEGTFFCTECGHLFDDDCSIDSATCPSCGGYKISLQLDLWAEPDPEVDDQG